jgi:hypothetical protein
MFLLIYSFYQWLLIRFTGLRRINPRLPLGKVMQQPANEKILPEQFQVDVPEIKKSLPLRKIDEELSEFERARQASKTWSMGQD